MSTATQTKAVAGFVGKIEHTQKNTRYGIRPVTTFSIGVRRKTSKTTSWSYVNIWGTPNIKKGDIVRVEDVKTFGRTRYGKLVEHEARNQRDRKAAPVKIEATPQQLPLF